MATNERTRRVAPKNSKSNSKPVYEFMEHDIERDIQMNEEQAIRIAVRMYRRWRERNVEFGIKVVPFADEWQKANPYRSAGYIRKTIQVVKQVHEHYVGIDLDSIEDMTHLRQLDEDRKTGKTVEPKKSKSTRETMRGKVKGMTKTELRILIEEAQALLDA
jgi:hypothetical protein